MKASFTTKILKCSTPGAWWEGYVGETIHVFAVDERGYWTRDTGDMHLSQWIVPGDTEHITPTIDKELQAKADEAWKAWEKTVGISVYYSEFNTYFRPPKQIAFTDGFLAGYSQRARECEGLEKDASEYRRMVQAHTDLEARSKALKKAKGRNG